jgi:3-hydroxybutyrate dehydrogenase
MSLNGKTAIVTGSTSGIGLGIARKLAAAGANILLNGFGSKDEIDSLISEFATAYRHYGLAGKVAYSAADLTQPEQVRAMVAQAAAELGGADILVNNAGIQHVAAVEEFPEDKWDAIIALNLSATFHAVKAALPGMKAKGWGRVVNIASAHGLVGSAHKAAYVAAKHGLIGLTKVIALEAANDGVTANAVCPGWVLTPLVEKQIADRAKGNGTTVEQERVALLSEKQPMHQFSTPENLGDLVLFLCGDAAASITGAALTMDGGWTAQ